MFEFISQKGAAYRKDYVKMAAEMNRMTQSNEWEKFHEMVAYYCLTDLFFLMYFVLGIQKINHPWLVDRVYEVQDLDHMAIDLWPRYSYKSSTKTFAKNIQRILRNPEERIGIFSHKKDQAKDFVNRIRMTLQENEILKSVFGPDGLLGDNYILYKNPATQSPKWTEGEITVHRKGQYQENTVEAHGLVDGFPTGPHFTHRDYDDVVTGEAVSTKEQMDKLYENYTRSHGLKADNGTMSVTGTRYHFADLFHHLIESNMYVVREYPATVGGGFPAKPESAKDTVEELGDDVPVLMTPEEIWEVFATMKSETFATQMLLSPQKGSVKAFDISWFAPAFIKPPKTRNYLFVDPANEKKKTSDYTSMWVVGVVENMLYVLDGVFDKLDIWERCEAVFKLVDEWGIRRVYYEKYSIQIDIDWIKDKMPESGVPYFRVDPVGGMTSKTDRIDTLQPLFKEGRIVFPQKIIYKTVKGKDIDLVDIFIGEEYVPYPKPFHFDMLDCLARINSPEVNLYGMPKEKKGFGSSDEFDSIFKTQESIGRYDWLAY